MQVGFLVDIKRPSKRKNKWKVSKMIAHKRALLSSKGISAFGLGGYPDSDEVELIPTVAGQRRTFTILLGSMITGFPLAAFASGLKATYAEYLVDMLEYSPGTTYGSRKKDHPHMEITCFTIRQLSPHGSSNN
jgi:hypothetical protein